MAVEVRENFAVRYWPMDRLSLFVDHDCGFSEDKASCTAGVNGLNGVTHHAGHAILIVGTFARGAFGDSTGNDGDGVMAALAVAREADSFFGVQQVDIAEIP